MKNIKGFTLIEMIVILIIVSILASIAIPGAMKFVEDATNTKYFAAARNIHIESEMIMIQTKTKYNAKDNVTEYTYTRCDNGWTATGTVLTIANAELMCELQKNPVNDLPVLVAQISLDEKMMVNEVKIVFELPNFGMKTVIVDKNGNASVYIKG